jgi:hypothetical protein
MTATDILLLDDARDSRTSFCGVIWNLDDQGSGANGCLAAPELFRDYPSGMAFHHYRLPRKGNVELVLRLQQVQPGTTGVQVPGFTAEAIVRATIPANDRQVMPVPVFLDRPISLIKELAGGP